MYKRSINDFKTSLRAIKIRGTYDTLKEATKYLLRYLSRLKQIGYISVYETTR